MRTPKAKFKRKVEAVSGIKAGAIVRLQSGGPKMTVSAVFPSHVTCMWFAGVGADLQTGIFAPASLRLVDP